MSDAVLMIGMVLIAGALGVHIPKDYFNVAAGFSARLELLNLWTLNKQARRGRGKDAD